MKTRKEWLMTLPSPFKGQAIRQMKDSGLRGQCNSLAEALRQGFIFSETNEGERYWQDLYARIEKGEFNPPRQPGEFRVGDTVALHRFSGSTPRFVGEMDRYVGKQFVLKDIEHDGGYFLVHGWSWCTEGMTLVEPVADSPAAHHPLMEVDMNYILAKAKMMYPIGTRYITAGDRDSRTDTVDRQEFCIHNKNIHAEYGKGLLYKNGRWAEIIR